MNGCRSCGWFLCLLLWSVCAVGVDAGFAWQTNEAAATRQDAEKPADHELRVMSFNIRFGTANDGENHWNLRKEFLVETIQAFAPDLLGTQETLADQRDYLGQQLDDYDFKGVGRDDGQAAGEMMAIYWKKARFEKLDGGHFWLSETPEVVASQSWDTSLPRMVTWVKLKDRQQPDADPIVWFNTHFDHRGQTARLESAKLIRQRAATMAAGHHVLITGDFNAGEDSPPYQALFSTTEGDSVCLHDTYRIKHPERQTNEGTFNGFNPQSISGPRIDWIAVCDRWQVLDAAIDRTVKNNRVPSDHFPVTAIVRIRPKP